MKKIILILVGLVSYSFANQEEYNVKDTIGFIKDNKIVRKAEKDNKLINGIVNQYENDKLVITASFKNGLFDGIKKEFKNDTLENEVNYKNGLRHGETKIYTKGNLNRFYIYNKGNLEKGFVVLPNGIKKEIPKKDLSINI